MLKFMVSVMTRPATSVPQSAPRMHNELTPIVVDAYRKSSAHSLAGEIYFYLHAPPCVRELFPALLSWDPAPGDAARWYDVQKVDGWSASKIYTGNRMTTGQLCAMCGALRRIHTSVPAHKAAADCQADAVDIYALYTPKLQARFAKLDYAVFCPNGGGSTCLSAGAAAVNTQPNVR